MLLRLLTASYFIYVLVAPICAEMCQLRGTAGINSHGMTYPNGTANNGLRGSEAKPHHKATTNASQSAYTLMQYNAEWLFIDHYEAFDCPGSQCTWANLSQAETHMSYVAKVVATLSPDILNVCEVEGTNELDTLAATSGISSLTTYFVQGTDAATGQNVGLLSKVVPTVLPFRVEDRAVYPIAGSQCGYTGPSGDTGVSKHYFAEMDLYGHRVVLVSAHLLAIPTDAERCAKREAQAVVLQRAIANYYWQHPSAEFIVMGDFNDYDAEVPDRNGHVPTSQVLSILKGLSVSGEKNVKDLEDLDDDGVMPVMLTNVAELVPAMERYTDWWDSDNDCSTYDEDHDWSQIDHILVSPSLMPYVKKVFMYHDYPEYCGKYDSDHYPMVVQFDFKL
jgi:endonuclease/exonuclease/phosphatase family metal-dependent hydrolase